MSWSVGFDAHWGRHIGYGVIAYCDHPDCKKVIDRGLAYVCGDEPYGGDRGCGLYFCEEHLEYHAKLPRLCAKCGKRQMPFKPSPEHPDWLAHILNDKSWEKWREENPSVTAEYRKQLKEISRKHPDLLKGE